VPKQELNYIMGNPPFVGARMMSAEQKDDVIFVFGSNGETREIWICFLLVQKRVDMMHGTSIRTALVSTNP
jgi:hypothetical protein